MTVICNEVHIFWQAFDSKDRISLFWHNVLPYVQTATVPPFSKFLYRSNSVFKVASINIQSP